MKPDTRRPLKNQLELFRKRRALPLKKVARLLGRKTTFQLSRYEEGRAVPNLKTSLKLGIIYKIPIQVLLNGCFEACREEIRQEVSGSSEILQDELGVAEFCTIEEKLDAIRVDAATLDRAASHVAKLIRTRSAKMDHI